VPEPATTTNRYLEGGYAPVTEEVTVDRDALEVRGRLPEALRGRYLRIGPNPVGPPPSPYHWFLGDGMVHGLELGGGSAAWYRNRWVRTSAVTSVLGEAPVDGPAQPMYDSSNTNVVGFAGTILALTEGCYPYVLDARLETVGRLDAGVLPHGMTAHPKLDPVTGELHAFSYWWTPPFLLYHVLDATGRVTVTEPINLPAPVSMHDFAITRDSVLFFDQPAVFDLEAAATTGFPFRWKPENGARVGVLPRGGTNADVRWYETETCYTFHPMNGFEAGDGTIVVDVPKLSSVFDVDDGPGPTGRDKTQCLERWTIDPAAGKVRADLLDDQSQDFCRINESLLGSPHRYGYTTAIGADLPYDDTRVFKHDLASGEREVHDFGAGAHPGEFVFVADPDRAGAEDGGWLLGLVHGHDDARLAVLDAQDVAAPPVAEVRIPRRVPFGFHGNWVAD
jgi:8'-apo-carotenoid 13,14-cleaving dioxygenase